MDIDSSPLDLDLTLTLNLSPLLLLQDSPLPREPEQEVNSIASAAGEQQAGQLAEELTRVTAENKRLTEMLTVAYNNYSTLRRQFDTRILPPTPTANANNRVGAAIKKRKPLGGSNCNSGNSSDASSTEENFISATSSKKPREAIVVKDSKIAPVCIRTDASDTSLIVKDGYIWRKYGQKVTRDNLLPRAYFKCSYAPSCPVKKKVQRSVDDQAVLVATYEGEHNHPQPCIRLQESPIGNNSSRRSMTTNTGNGSFHGSTSTTTTMPPTTIMLDLTANQTNKFMIEQMAASLTKDPNFTTALAAAISGRFI